MMFSIQSSRLASVLMVCFGVLTPGFASGAFGGGGGGEGWSLGLSGGITAATQTDFNTLIKRANARASGISTSELGNAWELNGHFGYRFSGSIVAMQFRPSYFTQSADGSGGTGATAGDYDYKINGFTLFPMFRFYLLESAYVKFYTQVGIGFGFITGSIKEVDYEVDFSGNDMGYMGGLGAEFCFMGGPHCMSLEGNMRYLSIGRLKASRVTGTPATGSNGSLSQPTTSGGPNELELDERDLEATLSGIQGFLGYIYYF